MADELHDQVRTGQTENATDSSTQTRRAFIKMGSATVASGLVLSAQYTKPSISTYELRATLDPSSVVSDRNRGNGNGKGKGKGKGKGNGKSRKK